MTLIQDGATILTAHKIYLRVCESDINTIQEARISYTRLNSGWTYHINCSQNLSAIATVYVKVTLIHYKKPALTTHGLLTAHPLVTAPHPESDLLEVYKSA